MIHIETCKPYLISDLGGKAKTIEAKTISEFVLYFENNLEFATVTYPFDGNLVQICCNIVSK